jgi:soluble lytic murein transglycosylase-like protein
VIAGIRRARVARLVVAAALPLLATAARADLWAYVDEQGHSHVANRQVDARYRLFFKGETTLDVPDYDARRRAAAVHALAGTRLYARATDPALARPYQPLIDAHARANGLDPALVKAVVAVESAFDPHAVSDKGAIGLMQVLPETAERYGVTPRGGHSIAERLADPATNLRIGTRYLHDLLARFGDDLALALAAYNAGEGTVVTHDNRVPPFPETRDYVVLVQQVYALYRPPASVPPGRVRLVGKEQR